VALTPTWNESSYFADYILPVGHASERHDLHSYEQYDGQWISFRQPVLRAYKEQNGERVTDTREVNPGEVWEENEFWFELSWRIDPDGSLGIRKYYESKERPGERMTIDEYYAYIFENSVPGLPEAAAKEGLTPLGYMRRYGAFEIKKNIGALYEEPVEQEELEDPAVGAFGRVFTNKPKPSSKNIVPMGDPDPDPEGRRPVGVVVDGEILKGFPTPSGKLEFYSATLAQWGWPEYAIPGYIKSHVHPEKLDKDQMVLISTFRLPVQIHTRSANSKWLDEIAHTNPVWIHPLDAERLGISESDLVRVNTDIGFFVAKPWITEGIKPGVVACSHHMGRWKLHDDGQRQMMRTVALTKAGDEWHLDPKSKVGPYESSDPDTKRIWWGDVGVHQNLTFPVHPDPVTGMHCWHQAVRVTKAHPGDVHGEVYVDTKKAREQYLLWMEKTRSAVTVSPDGTRRPRWLMRPLKPSKEAFVIPPATLSEGPATR
jgi:anaerobic selenocysteine-containing dehydrogenase